jgi:hypothetical protein
MFSLIGLAEPRIEPEIVFKFALAPTPGMDGCLKSEQLFRFYTDIRTVKS